MFPIAISVDHLYAERMLTKSSGVEVQKATTVSPTTIWGTHIPTDNDAAHFTRFPAPYMRNMSQKTIRRIFNIFGVQKIYLLLYHTFAYNAVFIWQKLYWLFIYFYYKIQTL